MTESPYTLLKGLTTAGIGHRRKLAELIRQGKVLVNNIPAENFNHPINPERDIVTIEGKRVNLNPHKSLTLMLNKPAGILSTTSDERGRKTIIDILPPEYRDKGLYPAGRLDLDSTGLIILTNDGELAYKLTHPRFEHEKEYRLYISGKLTAIQIKKLEKGIMLEDGMTHPARIEQVKSSHPYNYSITIHEGRKRQLKRMFRELGYKVFALKRVRIGSLRLGDLEEGRTRELSAKDTDKLLRNR